MRSFASSVALALALTPAAAAFARAVGIVDRPGELKLQHRPVPLLGGAAVVAAWLLGGALGGWTLRAALIAAVAAAFAIGLADDVRTVPPIVRIATQAGAGLALVGFGARLEPLGAAAGVITVLAVIAASNGVNLVDGLDGLAAGCAALTAGGLAAIVAANGSSAAGALALCGALLGFLAWNRAPARVFLGDAGAYAIGAGLVALVATSHHGAGFRDLAGAACCFGVFVVEPLDAVRRRIKDRRRLTDGDREHTYDRLVSHGLGVSAAVGVMWGVQASMVAAGVLLALRPAALPVMLVPAAIPLARRLRRERAHV